MTNRACPDCGYEISPKHHCPEVSRAGLSERYPSVDWGEREWYAALRADEGLFNAIMGNIAMGGIRPTKARGGTWAT